MYDTKVTFLTFTVFGYASHFLGVTQAQNNNCNYHFERANNGNVMLATSSSIPISTPAKYDVNFVNMWSEMYHSNLFPSQPHWSPPVILSHDEGYQMWAEDKLASEGVKDVAETGSTAILREEFTKAGNEIGGYEIGSLQFNDDMNSQTIEDIEVDEEHPYLSSISMIAPSPDWFSGFHDVVPITCDGHWLERFTVLAQPYDAGTDSGTSYTSGNVITDPQEPIFELTALTVPSSTMVFVSEGDVVRPVVKFEFTLTNNPAQTGNCDEHISKSTCKADSSSCCKWKKGVCTKKRKCQQLSCSDHMKRKKCKKDSSKCCKWRDGKCSKKSKCL